MLPETKYPYKVGEIVINAVDLQNYPIGTVVSWLGHDISIKVNNTLCYWIKVEDKDRFVYQGRILGRLAEEINTVIFIGSLPPYLKLIDSYFEAVDYNEGMYWYIYLMMIYTLYKYRLRE